MRQQKPRPAVATATIEGGMQRLLLPQRWWLCRHSGDGNGGNAVKIGTNRTRLPLSSVRGETVAEWVPISVCSLNPLRDSPRLLPASWPRRAHGAASSDRTLALAQHRLHLHPKLRERYRGGPALRGQDLQ